jgi:hypothetical protein
MEDGRIEGTIVAGLSRLMMGTSPPKKRGVCLPHSARSRAILARRFVYSWRAAFRGCIIQGQKTATGSKNRIENRSQLEHAPPSGWHAKIGHITSHHHIRIYRVALCQAMVHRIPTKH